MSGCSAAASGGYETRSVPESNWDGANSVVVAWGSRRIGVKYRGCATGTSRVSAAQHLAMQSRLASVQSGSAWRAFRFPGAADFSITQNQKGAQRETNHFICNMGGDISLLELHGGPDRQRLWRAGAARDGDCRDSGLGTSAV